jgi:hypothetical protein
VGVTVCAWCVCGGGCVCMHDVCEYRP